METSNRELLIRITPNDRSLGRWFELATDSKRNRSQLVMLAIKYYKETGDFVTLGSIQPEKYIKEKVVNKRLYRSPEFNDTYEWLKQQTNRPSSLAKKILAQCIKTTDAQENVSDEFEIYQKVFNTKKLDISKAQIETTSIKVKQKEETKKISNDMSKVERVSQKDSIKTTDKTEATQQKGTPKSTGDALLQALLPSNSGFKL